MEAEAILLTFSFWGRDFAALIHSGRREGMSRRSSLKAREEAAFVCANPPISKKSGELEMIKKERDVKIY